MNRLPTKLLILTLLATGACGPDDPELTRWQQQQVSVAQDQARAHSAAAEALVKADARTREDLVRLEREIQAERARVGQQRDALEYERKALAAERRQAPSFEALVHWIGFAILCALPLVICLFLLNQRSPEAGASELEEILIFNLTESSAPLVPRLRQLPSEAPESDPQSQEM